MAASAAYCLQCQSITETTEDTECQIVCTECGMVVADAAIQDPGSSGENFEQRNTVSGDHWSAILADPAVQSRHLLTALRKEDSKEGEAYRRTLADRGSILYSTISASLENLSAKLGLHSSLTKEAKELWYNNRHYGRLQGKGQDGIPTKIKVSHEAAPVLGAACIYWVCQRDGLAITSSKLAEIAEVQKSSLLKAYMNLQKAVGHPGQVKEADGSCLVIVHSFEEVLSILRSSSTYLAEETELLVASFCRLRIINEELKTDLTLVVGFLLHYKFPARGSSVHTTLQTFCKMNQLDFRSRWSRLEARIVEIIQIFSKEFDTNVANHTSRFVLDHVRDFVKFMELYDSESLLVELSSRVPISLSDIEN
ncbi:hypothetical protein RvY_12871 [Ramazzottius varieornatus]|uniref:TFIIB-type domain-containing protein n=1 Tax=Ramazzottius varieornatus TaxID=947166 RepID=A0A1D1VKY3_RAMVA|nr:hypothetical protein RvY_12871 [Ramazzottius varieornatus]